jgi:hypothetical protein
MKKLFLFLLSFCITFASILNDTKEDIFNLEFKKAKKDSESLKNSWLSPARFETAITKNRNNQLSTTSKNIKIVWNQDIFRSGGIFYAIKYAKQMEKYNFNLLTSQKLNLIKQI